MISYEVKFQYCNLNDALHRNITDNFESVSFDISGTNFLQVQIILKEQTNFDLECIEDLMTEFSAVQEIDNVLPPIILDKAEGVPLKHIVYQQAPTS